MLNSSKSRLLATSAIVGLSSLNPLSAQAQDAFGIHVNQPGTLEIFVAEGETVEGSDIGIYADNGAIELENNGAVRGNGSSNGSAQARPSGGVVIAQPSSVVLNNGQITGAAHGVATSYFFGENEAGEALPPQPLAQNTNVTNLGLIRGDMGTGVSLFGGGTIVNSGTIQGFNGGANAVQGTGVVLAEFPELSFEGASGIGLLTNTETGLIEGQFFGVVVSGGGTIDNAGTIRSTGVPTANFPGQAPFGVVLTANANQVGREATLNNSGVVSGLLGVLANASLANATINNSGTISGNSTAVFGALSGDLIVNNAEGAQIVANGFVAINSANGTLTLDNAGEVRSINNSAINIATADAQIENSGLIAGNLHGIVTAPSQLPGETAPTFRAVGTDVLNSGTIFGMNNDAVQLVGGGTIVNSGVIAGVNDHEGGTDGVSISAFQGQDLSGYESSVTNSETGRILGARTGINLASGGTIDNAGEVIGNAAGVLIENDTQQAGIIAGIVNSGLIEGTGGNGVIAFGGIDGFSVANSGTISGDAGDGIYALTTAEGTVVIDNAAGAEIVGAASGVRSEVGAVTLTNAGTIRGEGRGDGVNAQADGGVALAGSTSAIINSGEISGAQFGIVTFSVYDPATDSFVGTITATTIENSGTITGENDDGIRLAGGGTITNSGTIQGLAQNAFGGTDGVSIFAHNDQDLAGYSGTLNNTQTGVISGIRSGAALSSGGTVINAGSITGEGQGVLIQGDALDGADRQGQVATLENSGTISGTGDFGGTSLGGHGVRFGSNLETATLANSGTITSQSAEGVSQASLSDLTITNAETGVIEGGTSGIYGGSGGTMTIVNAGTIRGNGTYDGFDAAPDAGITIATASSSVANSGTISGAGAGITTAYLFDEEIGDLVGLAVGTQVTNSGTILGESNDGVRLIGGGSVTNSGTISGEGTAFSDGISMYAYVGQASQDFGASVVNQGAGQIEGERFGVILSGGGSVENAGAIGGFAGGVFIQGTAINTTPGEDRSGLNANVINSGTISGSGAEIDGYAIGFGSDLSTATLVNTGTITSDFSAGVFHGTLGDVTIANGADGIIEGGSNGIAASGEGSLAVENAGIIRSAGIGIESITLTTLVNSGTIAGETGIAVLLGAFDDSVTLRTGSDIAGAIDAGEGIDALTLEGDVLELTEEQEIGTASGFETLNVASGYWNTTGFVGEFGSVTIGEGAALQVNEVDLGGEDGLSSPIDTAAVTTNGLLVLNFSENDVVSQLDALTIEGAGGLQLIGEAVFTVDTDTLTYTGGTTISNGGMILSGTLAGDVTTEGDGFFQLGNGGTEGTFNGDIVNDGRFVFNRSDDYDFGGAFSGSGILDKMGEGVLTFLGDYAFLGVTNIFGGSVRIGGIIDPETDFNLGGGGTLDITGNDQTIGGLEGEEEAVVELGEQTLTIDQEENTEFAGAITGDGGIVKEGDGTLNLSGDSTYSGQTVVDGGILAVNGSIVSDVIVNAGGTLGGNGTVGETTVGDDGTLAPGNSIGQLTIAGDLNFAAGSIYEVEVNAAGEGDRVDATGAVTIASTAAVAVMAEDGDYDPRTDYTILTGAEGITGTFGSVTTDLAFLDPLLRYGANAVTLSLYRNDIDFADVAANANQEGVAGAVQALGIDNPLFEAVLVQNATTAQATFGDLSGEILPSTITGLTDDSRHLRNALLGMAAPEEAGTFVWGSAFGGWGDFDGNANAFGMDTDHKGFVAGLGLGGNGFGFAVSAGLGTSDFDLGGRSDTADVDSKYLAAHGLVGAPGGFHGAAGISYAWHEVETSRSISAPLAQSLASDRDANTLQVFGELGYDVVTGNAAITPFARLAHVSTDSDGFTETGGNAALIVDDAEQTTTFLSLGAKARFNTSGEGFQPYLSAAWNRAFGDQTARVDSRFAAGGPVFGVAGIAIPENSAEVEGGFDYTSGAFSVGAAYSGTLSSDRTIHGGRVTARFAF